MRKLLVFAVALLMVSLWTAYSLHDTASAQGKASFVGAAKCKTCHKKPKAGEQFKIWSESAHAKAYETLGTDKAKEIAKEKGIEDPQTAKECIKCHVTGYDAAAEQLGTKYAVTDGVGCESCHGAGGDYYKKKTMKSITMGEIEGKSVGLVTPDKAVCEGCHNDESPSFESFDFDEMFKKIAHPMPDTLKAEYKKTGGSK